LHGKAPTDAILRDAAGRAGEHAQAPRQNGFKQTLLRGAVLRALQTSVA